jgi:hypothetical protein
MDEKVIKKVVVFSQLLEAVRSIWAMENKEYEFYQKFDSNSSPEEFINEIICVANAQVELNEILFSMQQYYDCDKNTAILLYYFTDAYQIMRTPIFE